MNHSLAILLVSSCLLISTACVAAETSWTIESLAGSAFCFKTPLTVRQSGHDDINVIAEYRTDSFKLPVYYSIRLSRWTGAQAWELELVHAKIRLHNNPPEIQKFEISHGYNLIVLNLARKIGKVIYGLGAGIVLTHPENVVRVKRLAENRGIMNDGYYVSGPVVQLNVERGFKLSKSMFVVAGGKLSGAYSEIPVEGGHANVPLIAVHGLIGLGYEF